MKGAGSVKERRLSAFCWTLRHGNAGRDWLVAGGLLPVAGSCDAPSTGSSTNTNLVAKSIATGYAHACTVLCNGSVQCWGDSTGSELGDGTTTDSSVPVTVIF
jgi:hypothetical protein